MTRRASMILVCALFGCVGRPLLGEGTGDGGGTGETGGETSGVPTGAGEPGGTEAIVGTGGTGSSTTGEGPGSTASDDSCNFICDTTGSGRELCDRYAQDCPDGEKCAPYAEGGGTDWNATKCVPVTGDGQPGEPCTAIGGGLSGLDDCAKGVFCHEVDAMDQGTCVALCGGSADAPECEGEDEVCSINGSDILDICIGGCDPLVQDCPGDDLCVSIGDSFSCVADASGDEGQVFDPCEYANTCDRGLMCVAPDAATECDPGAGGCCLPICDLDADVVCPGVGQGCVSIYDEGMAPAKYANVGVCVLP